MAGVPELSLFPENLLDSPESRPDARWWILHTKPRAEKALTRSLVGREEGFYLPLYEHHRTYGRRIRKSLLPLFPGYLFFYGSEEGRRRALETQQVVKSLPVADQAGLRSDLQRIRHLLETKERLTPEERFTPGSPVRIIAGSFSGLTGTVIRKGRQLRFIIGVAFLQSAASAEVEPWMIEPLGESLRYST